MLKSYHVPADLPLSVSNASPALVAERTRLQKYSSVEFLPPPHIASLHRPALLATGKTRKMNRRIDEVRMMNSLRLETPEPESRQGRRNAQAAGVQLLDTDGAISLQVCSGDIILLLRYLMHGLRSLKRV